MLTIQAQNSFLLGLYREFHITLEKLKDATKKGTYVYSEEQKSSGTETKESNTSASTNRIYQDLVDLLDAQKLKAEKSGQEMGGRLYEDALFIMAAMADEVFLTTQWAGQEAWSRFLLETKFFGSNAGGEIFFSKLDALLKNRDPVYTELAMMYLLALSLGFR